MKMNIYKFKVYNFYIWIVRVKNLYGVYYVIIMYCININLNVWMKINLLCGDDVIDINECLMNFCFYGGRCINSLGFFFC